MALPAVDDRRVEEKEPESGVVQPPASLTAGPEPDEALEQIGCPSCGSPRANLALYGRDRLFGKQGWYRVVQCADCNMKYLNPRPCGESLARALSRRLSPRSSPRGHAAVPAVSDPGHDKRPLVGLCAHGRRGHRDHPTSARVVDVGCGLDDLLGRLREFRGCTGVGVDINPEVTSYIRDTLGMSVALGTLRDAHFETAAYDLVTMNQFLEHEPEPVATLLENTHLEEGGASRGRGAVRGGLPARAFGSCWSLLDVPRHLAFYTPETLGDMLSRCGYRLIHVKIFRRPLFNRDQRPASPQGFTRLGRLSAVDVLLITMAGTPFLPFFPWLKEFMVAVARAE